ncbi:hypothetical protein [Tranquillimonas alkanivorans]|uniref:Uncharacterized protein n=1 Tax=Tranquillimonas alkanivorans TaxID=441119 RepID=A0A1I5UXU4_9RHOB|nr:hypothetical protein [Tranquillimonas alkanivorans]SFQ00144.1 hypothetical protein SAMN04488047_12518 [Tranquillimonas alkanivorans]
MGVEHKNVQELSVACAQGELLQPDIYRAITLDAFLSTYTSDPLINRGIAETAIIDMMADVMHYCKLRGISFETVARLAADHFRAEAEGS